MLLDAAVIHPVVVFSCSQFKKELKMLHEQRTIEHHWHQQSCLIYCFQLF